MKRSRRVVLTMMGTAAVGAVSMGFVRPGDCGPGRRPGPDGRWPDNCRVRYGGFWGGGFRAPGYGPRHGGGGGGPPPPPTQRGEGGPPAAAGGRPRGAAGV